MNLNECVELNTTKSDKHKVPSPNTEFELKIKKYLEREKWNVRAHAFQPHGPPHAPVCTRNEKKKKCKQIYFLDIRVFTSGSALMLTHRKPMAKITTTKWWKITVLLVRIDSPLLSATSATSRCFSMAAFFARSPWYATFEIIFEFCLIRSVSGSSATWNLPSKNENDYYYYMRRMIDVVAPRVIECDREN